MVTLVVAAAVVVAAAAASGLGDGARALDVNVYTDDYYFPVVIDGETISTFHAQKHTHVEDEYQSYTRFSIDAVAAETFSPPTIEIVGANADRLLLPQDDVLALEVDGDALFVDLYRDNAEQEYAYELAVIYKCFASGSRDIRVNISYSLDVAVPRIATFTWTKHCVADRDRVGFSIVTTTGDPVVIDGVVTERWSPDAPSVISSRDEDARRFFVGVGVGSQSYAAPKIRSSQPFLVVSGRGQASTSSIVVSDEDPHALDVIQTCLTFGTAVVTVTYDIAPFHSVTFAWKKDCGERRRGVGFNVATGRDAHAPPDVVDNGVTSGAWGATGHTMVVGVDEESTTFHLRASNDDDDVRFGKPVVSVTPPLLRPELRGALANGGVLSVSPAALEVAYRCHSKAQGSAQVTLTFVLPAYKMIEFTWTKLCGPQPQHEPAETWTATERMLLMSAALLLVAAAIFYVHVRRRRQQQSAAVQAHTYLGKTSTFRLT